MSSDDDVFGRLEARFVDLSGLLERLQRYRSLAAHGESLYLETTRLSSAIRAAMREGRDGDALALEHRANELIAEARGRIDELQRSADYRDLLAALAADDARAAVRLAQEVFAELEALPVPATLYSPLVGPRGSEALEPEVGIERIRTVRDEGFAPTPGPGVGGDESVHPVRFFEGAEGFDVAVLLVVDGADLGVPALRASDLGEVLVYAPRLRVPLRVALRRESPDDWLEARPGGYAKYRARWLELLDASGFATIDL